MKSKNYSCQKDPKSCIVYRVYKKNAPLYFLYISATIKATEIVFIVEDRGDPIVRFEYKTNSKRYTVAEILAKWFGASIS